VSAEPQRLGIVNAIVEVAILLLIMTLSFRLLSVPLLLLYLALLAFWSGHRNNLLLICVGLLLVTSALQPLDVGLSGYPFGMRYGSPRPGLHFAPFVAGCPAHASLRQHYREYFCAEARWVSPMTPAWLLVWN
jgi:hypothetical protein